jgi:phosphate starvation-inducible PhoH-like protein
MAKRKKPRNSDIDMEEFSISQDFQRPPVQNLHNLKKQLRIQLSFKGKNQETMSNLIDSKEVVVCSGLAGTGKTYIACMKALQYFTEGKVDKIYLIKSVTTLPDEAIGFLKGDMKEKTLPFIFSFMTAFEQIIGKDLTNQLMDKGIIEFLPIAFIRGSSLKKAFIITDECQNISIGSMRTILSRFNADCKMVLLGDEKQVDLKGVAKKESSLKFLKTNFKDFKEFGFIEFTKEDQVRNPLINKIEDRFDELGIE